MPESRYRKLTKKSDEPLRKFLGELELAVMEQVWQRESATVRDVLTALHADGRALAYTTVMTVMHRLAEKGWLTMDKQGRAHLYCAACSRQEAEAQAAGAIVRALLEDFGEVAVAQFVKEMGGLDPEQLQRLADLSGEVEQDDDRAG